MRALLRPDELLLAFFLDDLFLDVRRHLAVGRQFHRERSLPLRHAPQIGGVAKSFGERHFGLDDTDPFDDVVAGHDSASFDDVTNDGSLEIFRDFDFDVHDRFEQLRGSLLKVFAEASLGAGVERLFGRVNVVVGTVVKVDPRVHDRILGDGSFVQNVAETLLDCRDVLLGNTAPHHMILEDKALFGFRPSIGLSLPTI